MKGFLWSAVFRVLTPLQWFGGLAMPSMLKIALFAALAIAPAGITWHRLKVSHAAELASVRADEERKWRAEIATIEGKINTEVERRITDAKRAGAAVADPKTDQELIEICKRSASCRKEDL